MLVGRYLHNVPTYNPIRPVEAIRRVLCFAHACALSQNAGRTAPATIPFDGVYFRGFQISLRDNGSNGRSKRRHRATT